MDLGTILKIGQVALPFLTSYDQSSNTRGAANDAMRMIQSLLEDLTAMIEESRDIALQYLEMGQKESSEAVIKYTMEGVEEVWKGAELGDEALEKYVSKVADIYKPVIDQGTFASDEMASMLNIKNSKGELVPFDTERLRQKPGYQFRMDEGVKAVEGSAVGKVLSGQTAKGVTEYGQGLADEYWNTHFDQLGTLAQMGLEGRNSLGSAYSNAGNAAAQLYGNAGITAGGLLGDAGKTLGTLIAGFSGDKAGLFTDAASTIANLGVTGAIGAINAMNTNATSQNNMLGSLTDLVTGGLGALPGLSNPLGNNSVDLSRAGSAIGINQQQAPIFEITPQTPLKGLSTRINNDDLWD